MQPYVKAWYEHYRDQGFTFPVAFDPKFATWNAYRNSYWPAFSFVDKNGHVRYVRFGEVSTTGRRA